MRQPAGPRRPTAGPENSGSLGLSSQWWSSQNQGIPRTAPISRVGSSAGNCSGPKHGLGCFRPWR
eukprot:1770556-Pyramimonas_sp.AAC.1